MTKTASITSKRQLTIPAKLFREAGFVEGQRVVVTHQKGKLIVEPASSLVERMAGSVKVPRRYRHMPEDRIIVKAKKEYFSKRKPA
jgi:bifunctional DNA-binding transcriptional regulator/antitoxin component of YhaV-PrlF toxin-antitoxin module